METRDLNPKYSLLEIERRWLLHQSASPDLNTLPSLLITDRYLKGTRMRLRQIEEEGHFRYKLVKKYGPISDLSEPITNIYLSQSEYELLATLPALVLTRQRFADSSQQPPVQHQSGLARRRPSDR